MNHPIRQAALCVGFCVAAIAAPTLASGPALVGYDGGMKPKRGAPTGCLTGTIGKSDAGKQYKVYFSTSLEFSTETGGYENGIDQTVVVWKGREGLLSGPPAMLREGDVRRDAFLLCLEPGRYFLQTTGIGIGGGLHKSYPRYRIPVTVVAGQTTYLGSFVTYIGGAVDPCDAPVTDNRMIVQDRAETDIPAIAEITKTAGYPVVSAAIVESRPPWLVHCAVTATP